MAEYIGRRTNLGIAKESSRGAGASPTYWLPRTELTFNDKATKVVSGEAHGHIDDSTDQFTTELYGEGTVSGEVRDKSIGLFLYSLLGSVSSSLTDVTAYTHTFTELNSNQHQSLCFVNDSPLSDDAMFKRVMISSFTLNVAPDGIVNYSADFVSSPSSDTTQSATYTHESRFVGKHANFKLATSIAGLTAAAKVPLKSLTLTFTKNTMRDHNIGTMTPTEIHNQQFVVEGSMTLNYEDNTYRDFMTSENYRSMRLSLTNTDVTLAGSSSNPSLVIDLSRCSFNSWEPQNDLDSISTQTINFKAHRDIANSLDIVNSITLTNLVTSY